MSQDRVLYIVATQPTYYLKKNTSDNTSEEVFACGEISSLTPAGVYLFELNRRFQLHTVWPIYPPSRYSVASSMINGFFAGCIPLDAVLASTFDCLYNISCLQVFAEYFPSLNQVCTMHSLLLYKPA